MPRKQHDYHFIYKTVNLINEKFYIGMHSTSNLEDGYIGSGKRLWYSIKKHGRENFKMEILEFLPDRSSLKLREKEIVNSDLLKEELCMNLAHGGHGGFINQESQLKRAIAGNLGLLKKYNEDPDFRNKMIDTRNTNLHSRESINKACNTKLAKTGSMNGWEGKKHSAETIEKFREIRKLSSKGEKNSQFGTCWITNGSQNKKIKKTETLPIGWKLGRVKI